MNALIVRFFRKSIKKQMSHNPVIVEKFEEFAKAYKYDTTIVCESLADEGEYKRESTQKAFVAFKNGFESASDRASELWDLLHELAPFVPGDFQSKVQSQLDAGI